MKLTKAYYFQYGSEFTPDTLLENPLYPPGPQYYPAPSGQYSSLLPVNPTIRMYINIPFKVKTIHIKGITWVAGRAGNQGGSYEAVSGYTTIVSSLVGNRPVGMIHNDSQFSMGTFQDIEHEFLIPETINGYYDFTAYDNDGTLYPGHDLEIIIPNEFDFYFDYYSITMEFNSEGEL